MQDKMDTLFESIASENHLVTDDNMVPDRLYFSTACNDSNKNNFNSIYYDLSNCNQSELISYNNLVNKELQIRGLTVTGNLETKRSQLIARMKSKKKCLI